MYTAGVQLEIIDRRRYCPVSILVEPISCHSAALPRCGFLLILLPMIEESLSEADTQS